MTTEPTLEAAIQDVEAKINHIGYTETETHDLSQTEEDDEEGITESEQERHLILAESPVGPGFNVIGVEDEQYVTIQSRYPLWQDIAEELSPDRAKELASGISIEELEERHPIHHEIPPGFLDEEEIRVPVVAAFELLDNVDTGVRKELVYQLTEIFTRAEVKHVVNSPSESGAPHAFTVSYKLFPYGDGFDLKDVNDAVEKVRMAAHHGTIFLKYAFNLGVDIEKTTAGSVHESPNTPVESNPSTEFSEHHLND